MGEVGLVVTRRVLEHVGRGAGDQKQIAVRGASAEIAGRLREVTARQRITLRLGGCVELVVGDPGAIWRAHQAGEMAADFDSLFELLSRRPDVEMQLVGEAV